MHNGVYYRVRAPWRNSYGTPRTLLGVSYHTPSVHCSLVWRPRKIRQNCLMEDAPFPEVAQALCQLRPPTDL